MKELFRKRDVQQITPIAFSETNENQVTTVNPANVADKTRENGKLNVLYYKVKCHDVKSKTNLFGSSCLYLNLYSIYGFQE